MQKASRVVHHEDAVQWLARSGELAGSSVVTSMPDFSEFPSLSLSQWKDWFREAARLCLKATPDLGATIFYQRDAKKDGAWINKSYLVQQAAEAAGSELLWHKIVCRAPPGQTTFGRPAYSHLLCFSRGLRLELTQSSADVISAAGKTTWTRGMGVGACEIACRFIERYTPTRTVVDPFCGHGSVLAVANAFGLDAVGVELGRKRAEKARLLQLRGGKEFYLEEEGRGAAED